MKCELCLWTSSTRPRRGDSPSSQAHRVLRQMHIQRGLRSSEQGHQERYTHDQRRRCSWTMTGRDSVHEENRTEWISRKAVQEKCETDGKEYHEIITLIESGGGFLKNYFINRPLLAYYSKIFNCIERSLSRASRDPFFRNESVDIVDTTDSPASRK